MLCLRPLGTVERAALSIGAMGPSLLYRGAPSALSSVVIPCRHAGHNKWSKIKRDKGLNDQNKCKLYTKLQREIIHAFKDSKGNMEDARLQVALQKARAGGLPKANIERALAQKSGDDKSEVAIFEYMGPANTALLIECLTDNRKRTLTEVRTAIHKRGANAAAIAYMFDKKGVLTVQSTIEKAMDAAIEAGAEDVRDVGEADSVQVVCDYADLMGVREGLVAAGLNVTSFGHEYLPNITTPVEDEEESEKVSNIIEILEDLEDVVAVYHNAV